MIYTPRVALVEMEIKCGKQGFGLILCQLLQSHFPCIFKGEKNQILIVEK